MRLPDGWLATHGWDFQGQYDSGEWEPRTREIIERFVTSDSTYVDLGAWVGPTVLWAAPLAARVLAVEPDPVARECLATNVAEFPHVEIVDAAIYAHTGTAEFYPHSGLGSSMGRLNPEVRDWNEVIHVPTITLPDLFEQHAIENVSLVKMDIEGGEADVLDTICPFLAARQIPLLVSLHPDWYSRSPGAGWWGAFRVVDGAGSPDDAMLLIP